eukprot:5689769-Prymnesium_polylepis.1
MRCALSRRVVCPRAPPLGLGCVRTRRIERGPCTSSGPGRPLCTNERQRGDEWRPADAASQAAPSHERPDERPAEAATSSFWSDRELVRHVATL